MKPIVLTIASVIIDLASMWRLFNDVGCTLWVSNTTIRFLSRSAQREVPVYPVCPNEF
jgi:hypothetical protein